jgi:hypothetical protein
MRLVSTPMVGELLSRVAPPSRKSVLRLARFVGEEATIAGHPDLIDLLVAVGRDSTADRAAKAELRALISPFALLSSPGFRRRATLQPDELRQLAMPTLIIWGEYEPLGSVSVAQSVTELIPHARLEVLPTGHGAMARTGDPDRRGGHGICAVSLPSMIGPRWPAPRGEHGMAPPEPPSVTIPRRRTATLAMNLDAGGGDASSELRA